MGLPGSALPGHNCLSDSRRAAQAALHHSMATAQPWDCHTPHCLSTAACQSPVAQPIPGLRVAVPESMEPSKSKAPVSPVSSSTVKSASRGGSFTDCGWLSRLSAAATPMPLSAPSVVPQACKRPQVSCAGLKGALQVATLCRQWLRATLSQHHGGGKVPHDCSCWR